MDGREHIDTDSCGTVYIRAVDVGCTAYRQYLEARTALVSVHVLLSTRSSRRRREAAKNADLNDCQVEHT